MHVLGKRSAKTVTDPYPTQNLISGCHLLGKNILTQENVHFVEISIPTFPMVSGRKITSLIIITLDLCLFRSGDPKRLTWRTYSITILWCLSVV